MYIGMYFHAKTLGVKLQPSKAEEPELYQDVDK